MIKDKEKEKNKEMFSKNICSYYKRKKLKKNEYWIPNPFAVAQKVIDHLDDQEILMKKDEKTELDGQKMPENLKKRGVAGSDNLNVN